MHRPVRTQSLILAENLFNHDIERTRLRIARPAVRLARNKGRLRGAKCNRAFVLKRM